MRSQIAGHQFVDFFRHSLEQRFAITGEVRLDGEAQILRALPVQRDANSLCHILIVRRHVTTRAVSLVQQRALCCEVFVELFAGRAAWNTGIVFSDFGHL
jgi:hypothetical protein